MASTITVYNNAHYLLGTGALNLSTDTIVCLLVTSVYTPNIVSNTYISDLVANEVTGNGYARQTLTYGTVTRFAKDDAANLSRFKSDNIQFTATGGSIVARYAVFAKSTGSDATSPVLFYVLMDSTPADVTATNGQKIQLTMNANGWLTV